MRFLGSGEILVDLPECPSDHVLTLVSLEKNRVGRGGDENFLRELLQTLVVSLCRGVGAPRSPLTRIGGGGDGTRSPPVLQS